jgi:hypothetical protein
MRLLMRLWGAPITVLAAAACSSGSANQTAPGSDAGSSDALAAHDGHVPPDPGNDGGVRHDAHAGDATTGGDSGNPPPGDAGYDAVPVGCTSAADCDGGLCTAHFCVAATCTDGVKDGNETDVDCGGTCPACGTGAHCEKGSDCASLVCAGVPDGGGTSDVGTCKAATCTDGVKNEGETDIDCGGTKCAPCAAGKACVAHTDCVSDGCDYTNHCALAASCTQHHGGDTCGGGEDTDLGPSPTPATGEESCCTTLPIAGTGLTVDKYLITAGRIRAWVTRLNGNLRAFTESIPATNTYWNPEWNQYIPSTTDEVDLQLGPYPAPLTPTEYPPSDTTPDTLGLPTGNWLGQWRDGCSMGSSTKPDGARTWWTDHIIGSDLAPIAYPQDFLDDKMINCIDSYMLTAFCIWDGGHLATDAELAAAWGPGPFPWSTVAPAVLIDQSTQEPTGTDSMGFTAASYIVHEFGLSADEFIAPFTYNYDPYNLFADNTRHIPAPGRFPLGNGPSGHADMAGAAYEATAITAGTFTQEPPPAPTTVGQVDHVGTLEGGTWEIHPVISGTGTAVTYDPWMPAYWAYWAMGSRCGR